MDRFAIIKVDTRNFEDFYAVFNKSVRTQFSHYTPATIAFYLEEDYPKKWLKDQIEKNKGIALIVRKRKEKLTVGYLFFSKNYGGVSFAHWLGVDPQFQNQGIASSLLGEWEKET